MVLKVEKIYIIKESMEVLEEEVLQKVVVHLAEVVVIRVVVALVVVLLVEEVALVVVVVVEEVMVRMRNVEGVEKKAISEKSVQNKCALTRARTFFHQFPYFRIHIPNPAVICQGAGHGAKECENDAKCRFCALAHKSPECPD